MIENIIKTAAAERSRLVEEIACLGAQVGEIKQKRAKLLYDNDLNVNIPEVQQLNEKLHNARRVLSVWNRRRESLDFLLSYVGSFQLQEGETEP